MTEEKAIKAILDRASAEVGYHETGENQTKYARDYDTDTKLYGFNMNGLPWCAYFISWLFVKVFGYITGSEMLYQFTGCAGASCASAASYFQQHRAWYSTPEKGDIIYFYVSGGINHTGIVEQVDGGCVTTIEGNSSDQVKRNVYRIADPSIAGYGRPAWRYAADVREQQEHETEYIEEEEPTFESNLDADSEFGPMTDETLMDFQEAYGLEADGIAGPETWGKIAEILGKVYLRKGDIGWPVTALQAALNAVSEIEST